MLLFSNQSKWDILINYLTLSVAFFTPVLSCLNIHYCFHGFYGYFSFSFCVSTASTVLYKCRRNFCQSLIVRYFTIEMVKMLSTCRTVWRSPYETVITQVSGLPTVYLLVTQYLSTVYLNILFNFVTSGYNRQLQILLTNTPLLSKLAN